MTPIFCVKENTMKQERLDPGWAWTRKYNISAGVKLGDTVQLSGIVAQA